MVPPARSYSRSQIYGTFLANIGESNNNSLQVGGEHRFSHGLSATANFTYSKCMGDTRDLLDNNVGGYLAAFATMVPGWDDLTDNLSVSPRANALILFNPVLDGGPAGYGAKRFGDTYRAYSPFYHVDASMPPTLIQSGDADKLVSPYSLREFQSLAQKAGVRCELVFYPGQPHSFFTPEPFTTQSLTVAATFLDSLGMLLPGPPPAAGTASSTLSAAK